MRSDGAGSLWSLRHRGRKDTGALIGWGKIIRKKRRGEYSKTREIYKEYKRSRNQKAYRAEHAEEIEKHEAAKAAFDALKGKTIPKVAQLNEEYAKLLAEKKACYEEYKKARQDMVDYQTARANVDKILGASSTEKEEKRAQRTEH